MRTASSSGYRKRDVRSGTQLAVLPVLPTTRHSQIDCDEEGSTTTTLTLTANCVVPVSFVYISLVRIVGARCVHFHYPEPRGGIRMGGGSNGFVEGFYRRWMPSTMVLPVSGLLINKKFHLNRLLHVHPTSA
uniref:(northern house mosquito) hypothetical protein n=1 Tax=Culex pipiens TaxID=7175 RepID=A0A8D8F1T8_CULPI